MSDSRFPKVKAVPGVPLVDGSVTTEILSSGGLFVYLETDAGARAACYWEASGFTPERLNDFVSQHWRQNMGSAKLIGPKTLIERALPVLQRGGISVKKTIEKSGCIEIRYSAADGRILLAKCEPKTRVLIVDDSRTIRSLLTQILSRDPELEVVAALEHPSEVEEAIARLRPDVITLDIHMPEMDGVTLLKRYISRHPIPTVMISSIGMEEGTLVLSALENGAVDYIQKPGFEQLAQLTPVIIEKVKTASRIRVRKQDRKAIQRIEGQGDLDPTRVIAIGASTGGTEALRDVLVRMPAEIPPIVIVQHIPPVFSNAFAKRLNDLCPFEVKEAEDGDELRSGRVLIAPGGQQMRVKKSGAGYRVSVVQDPPVNRHAPSVDVLFDSVADQVGARAVGAILTGMGADGAKGLLKMKQAGSLTIAQNEETCVVYGMPQAAVKLGAADYILPLLEIPGRLAEAVRRRRPGAA